MPANFGTGRQAAVRLGRRVATCLFIATTAIEASAQTTTTFVPGTRELFVLDLSGLKADQLPKGVTVAGQAKPSVVMKDGVPVLQATERTEIVFHLPEALPSAFTIQVVITPKASGAPEDVSFEGTPEVNRGDASMQVVWQVQTLIAAGGGEAFQMAMPDSIALTLPLRPVPIDLSFDGGAFRLFTDGKLLMDLTNRQFVRGRVLRVTLGGGCNEPGKCITPDSVEKYSVYLSKLRIAAGGGVVANQNTQSTSQSTSQSATQNTTSLSEPPNRNTIPKTLTVTVTSGPNGPIVSWPAVVGASGYAVSRTKIDDANCCNSASGSTYGAVSPWQDKPLPLSGTYLYRVVASTPVGQISGETQFGFRKPEVGVATTTTTSVTGVVADPAPTTGTITPATTTPPSTVTKTTMVDRSAPLNVATGPAPTLAVDGIPNLVEVMWENVPGAVRYEVTYAPTGTTSWSQPATPQPDVLGQRMVWVGTPPDPRTTYTYRVIAYQADGKMGEAKTDYKTPTMEPKNFTATAIAPGQVRFEWDDIRAQWYSDIVQAYGTQFGFSGGQMTYFLSGPGTGVGIPVVGSTKSVTERNSFTLTGVPAGAQTWKLTVNWDPGGIITPSTSWATTSATVAADPLPRYRLVVLGFKVIQQGKDIDDAHDGHGDEVYFSSIVNRTRLTGDTLPVTRGANITMPATRSHGDEAVSVPYGRIKAGTASVTGGLRTSDGVPFAFDPAAPTAPLQTLTFPLLLWQGTLGDSDAVVVHPMLWEDDVNPIVQATWARIVIDAAMSGYITEPILYDGYIQSGTVVHWTAHLIHHLDSMSRRGLTGINSISNGLRLSKLDNLSANPLFQCTIMLGNPVRRPCEAHGVDRPIGLEINDSGGFYMDWIDRIILLTPATIKAALEAQAPAAYAAWPPGTFSLKLVDNVGTRTDVEATANYELFFRIEKVVP